LKSLARTLNVPVIVLSRLPPSSTVSNDQLDRHTPQPIVQAADVVGLLVRPELYAENEKERNATKGQATLIIVKQCNGPTGDVPLVFHNEYGRFENP
jgi:replicative DNA helicase